MSAANETILSKQEKKWILERRVTRLSDKKEVQIYPMGAERYLSSVLFGNQQQRYPIRSEIEGKNVLLIPAYGNTSFLLAQAGAKSICAYDKDPITIAWLKAFKKYYHYREADKKGNYYPSIGDLMTALTCWYPPLLALPFGKLIHSILWILHPNSLRRNYIHYMVRLVQSAIQSKSKDNFELDKNIQFYAGTLDNVFTASKQPVFDTAFIPYLLGVENGIENEQDITRFMEQLLTLVPDGHILVNPTQDKKEFYILGKRYFVTTGYATIQEIPGLNPYFIGEDKSWFRTQGLALFGAAKE